VVATGALADPDEAFAQVLDGDGTLLDATPIVGASSLLDPAQLAGLDRPRALTRTAPGFDDRIRLVAVPIERGGERRIVVVGTNLGDLDEALQRLLAVMLVAGGVGLVVTGVAGWLLAGAALRPVEALRREASAISASEPERRLAVPATGDELARLATTLNGMLDRMEDALRREHRLVDDASHELRTPLATMRAEVELALDRPRAPDELREALAGIAGDIASLQRLTDDLLVLARERGGSVPLRRRPTRVRDLVDTAIESVSRRARARHIDLRSSVEDAVASIDPDRVRRALANLLDNALRYTPEGGSVRVDGSVHDGRATFVVRDSGPGFAPEIRDRAFDAFARGARADGADDGTGLGLAIVRAIAEAHAGSVRADNEGGARVTMTLGL
jgi:signal transduction histidine kinase